MRSLREPAISLWHWHPSRRSHLTTHPPPSAPLSNRQQMRRTRVPAIPWWHWHPANEFKHHRLEADATLQLPGRFQRDLQIGNKCCVFTLPRFFIGLTQQR